MGRKKLNSGPKGLLDLEENAPLIHAKNAALPTEKTPAFCPGPRPVNTNGSTGLETAFNLVLETHFFQISKDC